MEKEAYLAGPIMASRNEIAVDGKENKLDNLLNAQAYTQDLVDRLRGRLVTVSDSAPRPDETTRDKYPHIASAVHTQNTINIDLENIIDQLVI